MKTVYDFSHTRSFCITLGRSSGEVRLIGGGQIIDGYVSYEAVEIDYCPFCGDQITKEKTELVK